MKIIIPTFERIEWMPPTIFLIETLAKYGYDIIYITIYPDNYFINSPFAKRITNKSLFKKEISLQNKLPYIRGISGLLFRIDTLIKRIISLRLKSIINRQIDEHSLLWVVNETTVLLAGTRFLKNKKYAFTIYELPEISLKNRNIKKAAQNATAVIVPEFCRAHIIQSRYRLNKLPFVLPNKTKISLSNQLSHAAVEAINVLEAYKNSGIITILYMGGIGQERPLEPILNAIETNPKYRLCIMGRETNYLKELTKKYNNKFDYLGAFIPPEHIEIASHAQIGLLMYVSTDSKLGLNALFCAPNKLYEYTGKGLPVIANDIPGLRYPVLLNKIGCVTDFNDSNLILNALKTIECDYNGYSFRALEFYKNADTDQIIKNVLDSLKPHKADN